VGAASTEVGLVARGLVPASYVVEVGRVPLAAESVESVVDISGTTTVDGVAAEVKGEEGS
jgi:hypothetical protein